MSTRKIFVKKPIQFERPRFGVGIELVEVDQLLKASLARSKFQVSGAGLSVAVLDTGLNAKHVDFRNRVPVQVNYTDMFCFKLNRNRFGEKYVDKISCCKHPITIV